MLGAVLLLGATGLAVVFVIVRAVYERRARDKERRGTGGHIG